MQEKRERQHKIEEIIRGHEIESQEMLLKQLQERGFHVNQSTLSRDLKDMRIGRVLNARGEYVYAMPNEEIKEALQIRLDQDAACGCIGYEFSGNIGVLKTLPSYAQMVALAIDKLSLPEIVGTLAGDDTILIMPRDGYDRQTVKQSLLRYIPELKEKVT
ncbi:MAG: ArgR family transcriptional regulator [Spirochaetales bacterium]|nr:ArgR family transcriptional regulator [Spirochaetales bacterium]